MARLESVAVGGYYPTPKSVIPYLASMIDAKKPLPRDGESSWASDRKGDGAWLDPCAGEGAALLALAKELDLEPDVFAIELEKTRHEALASAVGNARGYSSRQNCLHGDAFRVDFAGENLATLLYLNPPYDLDPEHGRLEEKFLARFTDALAPGGVLVFLVPFYALKASADTLATSFEDVRCYRFPGETFDAYKQVALFARRRTTDLWSPDGEIVNRVCAWAADAAAIPEFPVAPASPIYVLPSVSSWYRAFGKEWRVRELDLKGLLAATQPWMITDRAGKATAAPGIVPEGATTDLLTRRYPLAMPPRPAHIAAGIAAGIFNGARIGPDDPTSPLPELLVKGVFDKEFRTVDEKKDKDGNIKSVVQVQQPKLVTTVLDLSTSTYTTIKASSDRTAGAPEVPSMTMADLLAHYGKGLMDVMLRHCPVLHDGRDPSHAERAEALPALARPLFHAQKHAVAAAAELLGGLSASRRQRRRKAAFVLGEIGSGKTSVAIATAQAIGARRTLVMCPPHLLASWEDQVKAVAPWIRTTVLNDVSDVAALAAAPAAEDAPVIAILSRETAKLGHAYRAVARCGACGTAAPSDVDHAKKRSRCEGQRVIAKGTLGRLVKDFQTDLLQVFPGDPRVRQLAVTGSTLDRAATRWAAARGEDPSKREAWEARRWNECVIGHSAFERLLDYLLEHAERGPMLEALELLLLSIAPTAPELLLHAARVLYARRPTEKTWSMPDFIGMARRLLLFVPEVDVAEFQALDEPEWNRYSAWKQWQDFRDGDFGSSWGIGFTREENGQIKRGSARVGDRRIALDAFALLANDALRLSKLCGEPLFQAIPEPRRFPLATYIAKRLPADFFDLLCLDEGHEYATDGSAQERSAHRLTSLGIPTLLLTGTVMNGYAESMFTNMWALSEDFRREFARDDRQRFIDRYGYRKRVVEDHDKATGKVVEFGAVSDRVERSERIVGDAPGVLPVFLLRYLLPMSVTLHKTDLAIDIPKCIESTASVAPSTKQGDEFRSLQSKLLATISRDRFQAGLAGKLWGALAELPSYLDCATSDVGNTDEGAYEIRYPKDCPNAGALVVTADALPASTLLPKEEWLLGHLDEALSEGRNVLVFAWHTRLLARIARLVKEYTGQVCPILDPAKVPTKKRQAWIDSEVVKKKRRVMVCNPVTVQTGLNNLVYFADEVWLENPACNPVVYRQAVGRVDRIGQTKPTRIVFPLYQGTLQEDLHSLLMQKVGVSMSADGLDGESAMAAAGIGDEGGFSTFSVGRQLYELLTAKGN